MISKKTLNEVKYLKGKNIKQELPFINSCIKATMGDYRHLLVTKDELSDLFYFRVGDAFLILQDCGVDEDYWDITHGIHVVYLVSESGKLSFRQSFKFLAILKEVFRHFTKDEPVDCMLLSAYCRHTTSLPLIQKLAKKLHGELNDKEVNVYNSPTEDTMYDYVEYCIRVSEL